MLHLPILALLRDVGTNDKDTHQGDHFVLHFVGWGCRVANSLVYLRLVGERSPVAI